MVLSAIDIYLVNFCSASCIVCCVFLALMRYSFSICPFPFNMRQTQRCRRRKQKTTTKMFMKMWRGNRMNRRYFICKTRLISLNFFKLYSGTDCLCPEIYVCISETTSQRLHFMRWTSIASAAMCKVHSVFFFFRVKAGKMWFLETPFVHRMRSHRTFSHQSACFIAHNSYISQFETDSGALVRSARTHVRNGEIVFMFILTLSRWRLLIRTVVARRDGCGVGRETAHRRRLCGYQRQKCTTRANTVPDRVQMCTGKHVSLSRNGWIRTRSHYFSDSHSPTATSSECVRACLYSHYHPVLSPHLT